MINFFQANIKAVQFLDSIKTIKASRNPFVALKNYFYNKGVVANTTPLYSLSIL